MEVFARLAKSIVIALAIITLGFVVLALLAWTKGLFMLLAVFGLAVYAIYKKLEWRAHSMRKGDRKWGV